MLMGSPFRLLAALAWTCDASTLLVPAYWWAATDATGACTTADFYALAAAGAAAVAVVNPDNGPIDASDANFAAFAACVAALGDARAVGYVYTKIAEETSPGVWEQRAFRDAGDVEADLDAWAASGLVEGVFLDEVSNSWAASSSGWADDATTAADHEAFYAEIFAAARSRFSFVVANPGSPYPLSYLDDTNAPDVVVLSEAAYAKWAPSAAGGTCADQLWTDAQGSFDEGPFCAYVPNWDGVDGLKDVVDARSSSTAQATLLYDADPALDAAAFVAAAYDAGVDYVYVTDRPVATPWDELPTFWDALVAAATDCVDDPSGHIANSEDHQDMSVAEVCAWLAEDGCDENVCEPGTTTYYHDTDLDGEIDVVSEFSPCWCEATGAEPTFAPTTRIACEDSASWFWKKSKYDCDYVAKKSKRCKSKYTDFDDVSSVDACPVACGECEPTCEDSTSWYWKKSKYDCAWVEKKIAKRCKAKIRDDDDVKAKEACPVACQEC